MKKNKRRIKYKSVIISIIILILIIILYKPVKSMIDLTSHGYSFNISYKIYKLGIRKEVLDNNYSETLSKMIEDKAFEEEKLDSYFKIDYYEYDNFLTNTNKWLDLGYSTDDINNINKTDNDLLKEKVGEKHISDISTYLSYDYFKIDKLDRYLAYFNGDYKDTIIKVNIGLDKPFYEDVNEVIEYSSSMIVNKYNKLSKEFVPPELTKLDNCSEGEEYLTKEAKEAYDKMCKASHEAGLSLGVTSSYRSYESQESVYNSYLKSNGQDYVNKYVATPGYSEHQTGLALDIKSTKSSPFKTTKEYKWMLDNSYKYGFILRYEEDKEAITGYNPEAWHFRFVGEDIANYIHENSITYEEYYAIFK